MELFFHHSYNLDLLNLLNIVAGDSHFQNLYPQVYAEFGQPLSAPSRLILQEVSEALESNMISAPIAFGLSVVPQFDKAPLVELMLDRDNYRLAVEQYEPRLMSQQAQLLILFEVLAPVLQELEDLGFREYWLTECLPIIEDRCEKIEAFYLQSPIAPTFRELINDNDLPDQLDVFFCGLNGGNGVRLCGHVPVVDVSFSEEKIFDFIYHDFFKLEASKPEIQESIEPLLSDTFIQLAFEKSQALTGIEEITNYVRENISTAYKSYLFHKSWLLADPIGFLQTFHQGAYILSLILMDHLIWEGLKGKSLPDDLKTWVVNHPAGTLMELYTRALARAGRTPGAP